MRIRVIGAAGGEVTGSAYFVQTKRANVLLECGMFQGGRAGSADPSAPRAAIRVAQAGRRNRGLTLRPLRQESKDSS